MGDRIPFRKNEEEGILREFLEVAKQPAVPKTEIKADRGAIAINGNNNTIVNYHDRLSNKEIRELQRKLTELAELIKKVKDCSVKESRNIAFGMFKKHFKLASYRDLPASRIDEAVNFLNRQLRIWEEKLIRKVPKKDGKHRLILRIYQLRSWNYELREEEFIDILKKEFGKTSFVDFSIKELRILTKLLEERKGGDE
jgi:hypothetical protein